MQEFSQFAPTIRGSKIVLRPIELTDAEFILSMRLDPQRNKYLNPTSADVEAQRQWIEGYKERERAGTEYYFCIEDLNGTPYGAVRIYDFRGDSFCWGSWLLRMDAPAIFAMASAVNIYEFAFNDLKFENSHFDVRNDNKSVIAFHKMFNAKVSHESDQDTFFTLSKVDYETIRNRYIRYK